MLCVIHIKTGFCRYHKDVFYLQYNIEYRICKVTKKVSLKSMEAAVCFPCSTVNKIRLYEIFWVWVVYGSFFLFFITVNIFIDTYV